MRRRANLLYSQCDASLRELETKSGKLAAGRPRLTMLEKDPSGKRISVKRAQGSSRDEGP